MYKLWQYVTNGWSELSMLTKIIIGTLLVITYMSFIAAVLGE